MKSVDGRDSARASSSRGRSAAWIGNARLENCKASGSSWSVRRPGSATAAVALRLAADGADVIVHGRSSHREAGEVVDEVRGLGRRAEALMADLADRAAGDRFVADAWDVWGSGCLAPPALAGADILTGAGRRLDFDAKLDTLLSPSTSSPRSAFVATSAVG